MWVNEIPLSGTTFSTQAHIARGVAQLRHDRYGFAHRKPEQKNKDEV